MKSERYFEGQETTYQLCIYGHWVCTIDTPSNCPIRQKLTALDNPIQWLTTAGEARFCQFRGEKLTKGRYNAKKFGTIV